MAITQLYTAIPNDVITAARWNNEFGNIYNNFGSNPLYNIKNLKDDYHALGDGITDDTAVFLVATTAGGTIFVPAGTYIISSVELSTNVHFMCAPGVVFKRKSSTDVSSRNVTASGVAIFRNSTVDGMTFTVTGDWTYDGNRSGQTTTEPTGMFLAWIDSGVSHTADSKIYLDNGKFTNGTSNYMVIKGDTSEKEYRTFVNLRNCKFYDSIQGKGISDPATPSALGYAPSYVHVYNYVHLSTYNFHAQFTGTLTTGTSSDTYSPTAVFASYSGVEADGGVIAAFHGTTTIVGLGRENRKYNDITNFTFNNALGAIDAYGNIQSLFIEYIVGTNCGFVPVRGKGSARNLTVLKAEFTNCAHGIQFGPSSTGACESDIYIGSVAVNGGGHPQVEIAGTSTSDRLVTARVDHITISGTITDNEGYLNAQPTVGVVGFKNIKYVSVGFVYILSSPSCGLTFASCDTVDARHVTILGSASVAAVYFLAVIQGTLDTFSLTDATGHGIDTVTSGSRLFLKNGYIHNCVDYALFANETTSDIRVTDVTVGTISGVNRGFYKAGGGSVFIDNCAISAVGTPVVITAGATFNMTKPPSVSADKGDAAATLTAYSDLETVWNTPLTVARAVTLSTTGAMNGARLRIIRTAAATGAFNLNVGTGPLKALTAGQWCEVMHNGTAWYLSQFGAL